MRDATLPPRRSAGRAHALWIAVVGGVVCGLVGGGLAAVLFAPSPPSVPGGPSSSGESSDPEEGVGPGAETRRAEPEPTRRRRRGRDDSSELARRLGSPDEDVRHAAVLEVMREGRAGLRRLRRADPPTHDGQMLVASAYEALQDLVANESHPSHERLSEVSRLELRLDAFSRVVPEYRLREERLAYWELRVELEERKREVGTGERGAEALARLERDRVLLELGRIEPDEFRRRARELHASASAWVAALAERREVPPARVAALRETLARLESRLD